MQIYFKNFGIIYCNREKSTLCGCLFLFVGCESRENLLEIIILREWKQMLLFCSSSDEKFLAFCYELFLLFEPEPDIFISGVDDIDQFFGHLVEVLHGVVQISWFIWVVWIFVILLQEIQSVCQISVLNVLRYGCWTVVLAVCDDKVSVVIQDHFHSV